MLGFSANGMTGATDHVRYVVGATRVDRRAIARYPMIGAPRVADILKK